MSETAVPEQAAARGGGRYVGRHRARVTLRVLALSALLATMRRAG